MGILVLYILPVTLPSLLTFCFVGTSVPEARYYVPSPAAYSAAQLPLFQ